MMWLICHLKVVQFVLFFCKFYGADSCANCVHPDQILRKFVASDLGLHCLPSSI